MLSVLLLVYRPRFYTSSKIVTKNKYAFRYGKAEARLKLSDGGQVRLAVSLDPESAQNGFVCYLLVCVFCSNRRDDESGRERCYES